MQQCWPSAMRWRRRWTCSLRECTFGAIGPRLAPSDLPVGWVLDFADGLFHESQAAGVSLLGGDVTKARDITIAVTAIGSLEGREPVLRSGARPGNVVAIQGRLGWAAAGLAVLARGFRSPRVLVEAQRVPQVSYGAGAVAAQAGATSIIDISDGLLADLGHVAQASDVVIDLRQDAFEVAEPLQAVAAASGADPYTFLFTGGDDHALAATFPSGDSVPEGWLVVGRDRKSTRLNSSHQIISYAVFCLKKKK